MRSAALKPKVEVGPPHEVDAGEGPEAHEYERMERIAFALHEMCQPLMALQCRLEIGRMIGTPAGYEEAVREGLTEYERLFASVDLLRDEIRRGLEVSHG